MEVLQPVFLVIHIIGMIIAVGSATVVDYLHLVSLKRKRLEKRLVNVYPLMSKLINVSLAIIYLSGILLFVLKPELLASPLFKLKVALVLIVTINGIFLQKTVSPHLEQCIIKGTKYCTPTVLNQSAISGSISIVTWYAIVILALTKTTGYTTTQYITGYLIILAIAIITSYSIEKKARRWRNTK